MAVTRRTILKAAGASALCGASLGGLYSLENSNAWAQSSIGIGDVKIDVLSDGNLRLPIAFTLADVDEGELKEYFTKHNLPMEFIEPACNLSLVRDGERTILFDVGSGANFQPSAGKIAEALEAIGLDPSQVTHVIFTHAHPDHLWGLLDEFDDPYFSEAQYMISRQEWDYWIDPDTVNNIGENRQVFAAGAMRNLKAIEDQITRFDFETEILPGVRAIDTRGHTPGHTSFEVRSGSQSIAVVGDVLTNTLYSFDNPQWHIGTDQDKEMAVTARENLLDQLATDKMQMIGYHFPFPGIGRVERAAGSYRFVGA